MSRATMQGRTGAAALGLLLAGVAVAASAQTRPPPPAPAVQPPATNVDPHMKIAPRNAARLPTPVIHPPIQKGDTVIVPK